MPKWSLVEAMKSDSKDASLPWENPASGARGTVTPVADAYVQEGALCRDFLASYVARWLGILDAGRSLPRPAGNGRFAA